MDPPPEYQRRQRAGPGRSARRPCRRYLAKLFTKLARRRPGGGNRGHSRRLSLARPAGKITVLDVVEAIDGDKALFDCREIRSRLRAVSRMRRPPGLRAASAPSMR
ncbi:Rrf2 family transcriptional regulator [Cupriavidus basilensis]